MYASKLQTVPRMFAGELIKAEREAVRDAVRDLDRLVQRVPSGEPSVFHLRAADAGEVEASWSCLHPLRHQRRAHAITHVITKEQHECHAPLQQFAPRCCSHDCRATRSRHPLRDEATHDRSRPTGAVCRKTNGI